MEFVSQAKHEIQGRIPPFALRLSQQPLLDHLGWRADLPGDPGNTEGRVKVSEAAGTFLDMRLLHIDGRAVPIVALVQFLKLLLDQSIGLLIQDRSPQFGAERLIDCRIAGQVSSLHHRAAGGQIHPGHSQAIIDGTAAMPHDEPDVPEGAQDRMEDHIQIGIGPAGIDKHQIHVGGRVHLASAIAAQRDQRAPVAAPSQAWIARRLRQLKERSHHRVGQCGDGSNHRLPGSSVPMKLKNPGPLIGDELSED